MKTNDQRIHIPTARGLRLSARWIPRVIQFAVLVLPLTAADYQTGGYTYTLTSNVTYGRAVNDSAQGYEDLKLDIYTTSNPATDKPAVIYVHGGGWVGGFKNDPEDTPTMQFLAQHGFMVFSIDYRLANDFDGNPNPSPPLPGTTSVSKARYAGSRDTKTAIRWVRANAAAYGIASNRIVVMGPSAGGGNVVNATYSDPTDYATDYATDPYANYAGNNPTVSPVVQGCVDLWGVTTWALSEVQASDAPTLIAHGRIDATVNYTDNATALANACAAAGAFYELHPLVDPITGDDYGHGPQAWGGVSEVNGQNINNLTLNWFIDVLGLMGGGGNTAPTISDIANQTISQNGATGPLAFTVGDAETAAGSLTVSGSSSNTTLVPNVNIAFGGSGANRTVTVTPATGQSGTATITVTVSDGSLTAQDTFVLTVNTGGQLIVYSQASQDGWILESGENTTAGGSINAGLNTNASLRTGDDNTRKQYRSVVSFDTSALPDNAVIDSVTLRLTRGTVVGNNTNMSGFGTLNVAIRGGSGFANNVALATNDFANGTAPADLANVVAGGLAIPTANGQQTTGTLISNALQYVNKTGTTQFRIDFGTDDDNDGSTDYMGFYSGENTTNSNKPQLVINYH